ncbi:MAG: LysM peptidoglycan-binding domain-containing protein [Nitrospirae bacterium]|nr:LysM peptidoglycan-binding domain-containing protein [Nitrospirota bacterium]MCL5977845.1 LysM peptidoglycan-binding domain-containing protein [Nitrospirota bacterium]
MSLEFGVKSIKKITSSAFFFIICYLFLSINAYAATTYTVKNGDSLYKISKKFDIPESELKRINALKTNKLKVGQKIRIKNSDRKAARKNLPKDKSQKDTEKTYTVKKGDTVYRIAKRFDIGVEELKELNELKNNSLKIGQMLIISEKMEEPVEPEDIIKSIQVQYDRKANPVVTSARLEEVKELSSSNDLSKMSVKERLMLFAKKMLHLPYKFGGNGAIGVDCSAYVQKVYGITGITIPRSAREQFRVGESVDKEELSIGDLVFFRTYASFPSHVGIYLGNNLFIHASSRSKKITIDSLESPYYFKRFIGAKRLIEEEEIKITEQSKDLKIPPITPQD